MKNPLGGGNGMVPHYSGTTLDAQARYAAGTKSILENYLLNKPQEPQNIIVGIGKQQGQHLSVCGSLTKIYLQANSRLKLVSISLNSRHV